MPTGPSASAPLFYLQAPDESRHGALRSSTSVPHPNVRRCASSSGSSDNGPHDILMAGKSGTGSPGTGARMTDVDPTDIPDAALQGGPRPERGGIYEEREEFLLGV